MHLSYMHIQPSIYPISVYIRTHQHRRNPHHTVPVLDRDGFVVARFIHFMSLVVASSIRERMAAIDDERDDEDDDDEDVDPDPDPHRRSIDPTTFTTTTIDDARVRARRATTRPRPMISGRMKRARTEMRRVNATCAKTRSDRALGNGRAREDEREEEEGDGRDGGGTRRRGEDRGRTTAAREETMRKRARFDRKFRSGDGWCERPRYAYEDHEAHRDRSDDEAEARVKTRTREEEDEDAVGGVGRRRESASEDGRRLPSSSGGDASEETKVDLRRRGGSARAASEADSDATETETETARRRRGEEETTTTRGDGRKLTELFVTRPGRKNDTSTLKTTYCVLNQGVAPEELLQGEDVAWWRAFETQGAMVIRLQDGWDFLDDTSALCDLSWIGSKKLKLRTLGPDYQFLRQNLPDNETGMLEPFRAMEGLHPDTEVGAFVEDFQESARAHADQFRLMDVHAREGWFLQQIHAGFPIQFPYLQGIALEALLKNVRQVDQTEEPETHPWDPRTLGMRKPSVLKKCLQLCEATNFTTAPKPPPATADSETQKVVVDNVIPQTPAQARAEERARTGGEATRDSQAKQKRRMARREEKKKGSRHTSAGVVIEAATLKAVEKASEKALWGVGITTPWLYYMSVGSIFPMHFEDYAFASANVILTRPDSQSAVVWYSIPRSDLYVLHKYLQELLGDEYTLDILEMRRLWLNPARIEEWNAKRGPGEARIHVYKHVQGPGDYVVTDYGSVHWGVNLGDGWKAAVNFAYMDWKSAAEEVDDVYKRLEDETGLVRHHRSCPKFHLLHDYFSDERMRHHVESNGDSTLCSPSAN